MRSTSSRVMEVWIREAGAGVGMGAGVVAGCGDSAGAAACAVCSCACGAAAVDVTGMADWAAAPARLMPTLSSMGWNAARSRAALIVAAFFSTLRRTKPLPAEMTSVLPSMSTA